MKDFQLRNDTKLLFCNDPVHDLADLTRGRNVLFVYGGGSVKKRTTATLMLKMHAPQMTLYYLKPRALPVKKRQLKLESVLLKIMRLI